MTPTDAAQPIIVLIGNYPLDRQESMLRFHDLMQARLEADGYTVVAIAPEGRVGLLSRRGALAKWLGYVDKYILFPLGLSRQFATVKEKFPGRKIVVHICDHSNAVYARAARKWFPVLVTCHDLLAVRGARGEDVDCPASGFGKFLQAAIFRGLGEATAIACVSRATQGDLERLGGPVMAGRSSVVPLALNYAYEPMAQEEAMAVLAKAGVDLPCRGFILHVGSGALRKNRKALPLAVASIAEAWPGKIAFAGEALGAEERAVVRSLGLEGRILEVARPENETLRALYSAAHALVFMSRSEGFGWPILEAQAAGCPVICSNRTSVPEVAGEGALVHKPDDYAAVGKDILRLESGEVRETVVTLGFRNVQGYTIERMMASYEDVYRRI
jgi:glycosyltransferase involved in cell wall biosynthesis